MDRQAPNSSYQATVVVPTHGRKGDLEELLASLGPCELTERGVEVLVVDDASEDGTVEMVQSRFPAVHILVNEINRGPAFSRNRAGQAARGRYLFFLDSDGVVAPGWIDALLGAGIGGAVLLGNVVDYEGGRVQGVPRRATFLGKSLPCSPARANTGPSCNLGMPRAVFEQLGGFDEDIPYYFEDSDLCIRARHAGCSFCFVEDAVFRHKGSEKKSGNAIRMQERNSTYAMLKAYRNSPPKLLAYIMMNSLWLCFRLGIWTLRGRVADSLLLWKGAFGAYRQAFNAWRK